VALKMMKSARAALEGSRGSDTAPTLGLEFDEAFHQQEVQTLRPLTVRGSYFGYRSAAAGTETNTLEMNGPLGYDMGIWLANTHIKAVASGTGGAADKTWSFVPTSASDDIKSASIQIGYSDGIGSGQPAAKILSCLGDELSVKWDKTGDGAVTFTSRMVSPLAAAQITAFTGAAAAIGSAYIASSSTTAVTIDTSTIGSTADTQWTDLTWTLNNGFQNLYTLNNSTAATATYRGGPRVWKLEGSRYYQAKTEWDAYIAKTPRKVRIKSTGIVIPTTAATYTFQLDLYGVYTAMTWSETDDLGFQQFTLEPIYDTGASTDFGLTIISALAAIT